ncbi:MAG: septal ring lytic transglycosylase RlpA family protein [Desulfobacterales bacterium]
MCGILRLRNRLNQLCLLLVCACVAGWGYGCASNTPPSSQPPPGKSGHPKPYKVLGRWYQPLPHSDGFRQSGLASWYGRDFHGKKTSNGERYNMYAMTAAHKTLPLGTYVRVHNLENNRGTVVRINDRGPFVRGRIIDLSYSAAKEVGIIGPGTARVEVVALGKRTTASGDTASSYTAGDYHTGNFTYQVGAFLSRENAEKQRRQLAQRYKNAHITVYDRGDQIFYRVRVGHFTTLEEAVKQEKILIQDGFVDAILVAE